MKSRLYVVVEGSLYFIIAAVAPFSVLLSSTQELSGRNIAAASVAALASGAVSVKAFLSQSMSEPPAK